MLARVARLTGTPLPALTGGLVSPAEWDALTAEAEQAEWTRLHELAALTLERVDAVRFMVQKTLSKKGSEVAEPIRVPRPGDPAPKPPKRLSPVEFAMTQRHLL